MGKKTIPYTVTNSFFYVKESAEPLPFMTIAPDKVDHDVILNGKSEPVDHSDFLRQLGKSIKNLKNC